jgi:CheY-like chemotaxis protein
MMRVGSKPIEFELYVDENIPAQMSGDELRVKQILNNLLSNAFKYTAEGRVNLSVTAEDDDENEDRIVLVVSVSDTGQGMTKEQVAMLYDEYSRFNQEANRTTEGTGLGMNITRNLIQLMSGSISVESEPGVGSTFTVRLPQQRIDSGALGIEVAENLREFRAHSRAQMKRAQFTREPMPYGSVLIVDDVETNIYVAKGLLAPYRLRIDSAESGFAAIEKVRGGGKYDIIFMDHMMPKMDGVEATKHIRGMGYSEPIVALTANAVAGQADIFLGNGFDDFISKPIDLRQMNLVLNKLIRDKQPPEILEAARKHAGIKPHADDVNAQITEVFLRDTAKTLAALEAIAGHNGYSDEDNLRTYIINIHGIKTALANMGNMELSAVALKLEAAGRENKLDMIRNETPAFLLSLRAFADGLAPDEAGGADTSEGDAALLREKLLLIKQACEEYDESTAEATLKELRGGTWAQAVNELLSAIAEHLLHSDFDLAAEAAGDYSAGLSEAAETSETAEPPGIDVSKGLESCNGDQKIYMQILRAYTTNMRALAESVETVTPEDLPDYKTTVHGIKGASASVFAEEVSRLAGALESAAKDGDFDYIRDNNAALLEALRKQICSIESFVVSFENENPKPVKEKPDGGLLLELLAACKDYDMGRADEVMEEIAQFRYEAGGEFVEWLRERVCMVKFAEIEKRLPEFLEGEFKQL